MNKVKLTREQAEELEIQKRELKPKDIVQRRILTIYPNSVFTSIELDTLIKALYIGYEIKEEFKVGDWVVKEFEGITGDVIGKVEKIDESNYGVEQLHGLWSNFLKHKTIIVNEGNVRHATPEEIEQEKERRWWAKHDRKVWELRVGDVLWDVRRGELYSMDKNRDVVDGKPRKYHKIVCFAEERLDLNE